MKALGQRKHKKEDYWADSSSETKTHCMRKGLLYWKVRHCNRDEYKFLFVLPSKHRDHALKVCHSDIGHLGVERCLDLLKDGLYWPTMAKNMETHVMQCDRWLHFEHKLNTIETIHPIELVHIDYLIIESGKSNKDVYILVVTDHFTRHAQAFNTSYKIAKATAKNHVG